MENKEMTQTTIQRGPYDSKKKALAVQGKLFCHGGKIYRALNVKAYVSASFDDAWVSEVDARPATAAEERTMRIATLRKELDHCRLAWSDDPNDAAAVENRANFSRLRAEIAELEAANIA